MCKQTLNQPAEQSTRLPKLHTTLSSLPSYRYQVASKSSSTATSPRCSIYEALPKNSLECCCGSVAACLEFTTYACSSQSWSASSHRHNCRHVRLSRFSQIFLGNCATKFGSWQHMFLKTLTYPIRETLLVPTTRPRSCASLERRAKRAPDTILRVGMQLIFGPPLS